MMFNSRPVYNLPDFVFSGGAAIGWVNEFRYLGLTLANTLTYANHISNVSLNISRITGALVRIRDIAPLKVLIKLYNSLALPHLMHHIIIWGSAPACQMDRLFKRVSNLLRMILGIQWENGRPLVGTNELYKTLGILKLNSLYKLCIFKFLRQLLDGKNPDLYDMLLRPYLSNPNYGSRGNVFRHPPLVCEIEGRFFPHQRIILCKDLPQEILNDSITSSVCTFKLRLLNEQ